MNSSRSVLVAYDGTDEARRALEHAAGLARAGGRLAVIHVIPAQSVSSRFETVTEAERSSQDEILRDARHLAAERGIEPRLLAAVGDPATEILAAADELEADVIVVGRRAGLHRSLSSRLARRASRDVLIVH